MRFTFVLATLLASCSGGADGERRLAKANAPHDAVRVETSLPESFDWRTETKRFPPVRDQFVDDSGRKTKCGSCWAFAELGALEAALAIFYPDVEVPPLSEQELVNCVPRSDCGGGSNALASEYLKAGVGERAAQPYDGKNERCLDPHGNARARLSRYAYIGSEAAVPDEDAVKAAVLKYGPVVVPVFSGKALANYHGGLFGTNAADCKVPRKTNHIVAIVGWGKEEGRNFWIVRNSYGVDWGEKGYARMTTGCADLAKWALYLVAEPVP